MEESDEGSIGKRDYLVEALFIANDNTSSFLNINFLRGRQRKEEAVFYY